MLLATPYISSLPITSISARQRGPCTAKLFITLRGGQKHAWLLHSMPLPFSSQSLMQRNSRLQRMIYSPSLQRSVDAAPPLPPASRTWGERWAAPRGPMHNPGHLCVHIHLYQWAMGKCKPKVIAPDKNICLVNKYSNEGARAAAPQTDAGLTAGLRRDAR